MIILKTFEEFVNESQESDVNEGWKDVVAGILLLLGSGGAMGQVASRQDIERNGDKVSGTVTKTGTFKSEKELDNWVNHMTKKHGFTSLDDKQVDTIWKKTKESKPDTVLSVIQLKFDKGTYFESGKYEVSSAMKDSIKSVIDELNSNRYTLINVNIVSSTDKQGLSKKLQDDLKSKGFQGTNKGLSKARSASITDFLTQTGINDSIINEQNLAEQGTEEIDAAARYIVIEFKYFKTDTTVIPPTAQYKPTTKFTASVKSNFEYRVGKIKSPGQKEHHVSVRNNVIGPVKGININVSCPDNGNYMIIDK